MNQIEWQESFNIGVDTIDQEHQRLFKIINRLFAFQEEEKDSQWACQEGIKFFKGHTMKHFADEEAYMESIGYKGLEQHRRIHQSFRTNTLPALEQELEQTRYSPDAVEHFLGVCAGWLIGHTLTEDQAITGHRPRQWENQLPGEDLEALKKVIIQLVFDLFHLESHMVSDAYGGEKFGEGVYYRLVYGTDQTEQRMEVILAFEEKLLINTVGKVMGFESNKLDNMLVHAARYTARQFVGRVLESFPVLEGYELKEENLLDYEQLKAVFRVEKYLAQRAAQARQTERDHKRKVLVVDDSMTIREAMRQLLGGTYEVSLASSGVAAIRTISLDRPDLVLLDYEMPVCDGKQTLETPGPEDDDRRHAPEPVGVSHQDLQAGGDQKRGGPVLRQTEKVSKA